MIVLDTHAWVWWVQDEDRLSARQRKAIKTNEADIIGISVISCWEVAKLVQKGRLELPVDVVDWVGAALAYPGVRLLELSPDIAIASTRLPGEFHNDPADQLIVATARVFDCPLVTSDSKVVHYPYVETIF